MKMFLFLGIVALLAVSGSIGQEACTTVQGAAGTCISLKNCKPLMDILRLSFPLRSDDANTLRNSQCGYEEHTPKVCCPNDGKISRPERAKDETPPVTQSPPDVSRHQNLRLLGSNLCGAITETRIVQGNKTTVLEFPWMALIGYKVEGSDVPIFKCGGTLISKRYILTAAHCVSGIYADFTLSSVRLGEHDIDKEKDCDYDNGVETVCADKYQDFAIESFQAHGEYDPVKHTSDIALIRLDRDVDLTKNNVKPICLPAASSNTLTSSKAIVTGWGRTETGYRSQSLLKVKLPIVPNDECGRVYKDYGIRISEKQLCAGGKNGMDSCGGDSGGPLQYPDVSSGQPLYYQYGLVSFGPKDCGVEGYPGIYTKVAYYMDWILDTMKD